MIKNTLKQNSLKTLNEDGVILEKSEFECIMREFYDKLRNFYSISGTLRIPYTTSVQFKADKGKYFPCIEYNGVLLLTDDVNIMMEKVNEIKFWFSNFYLDFSLKLDNDVVVHFTAQPCLEGKEQLKDIFEILEKI